MKQEKPTYEPRHARRRPWYRAVADMAMTHPRLFALITIASYISTAHDLVVFLGEVADALLEIVELLTSVVG